MNEKMKNKITKKPKKSFSDTGDNYNRRTKSKKQSWYEAEELCIEVYIHVAIWVFFRLFLSLFDD